jgi:hypothetical protein
MPVKVTFSLYVTTLSLSLKNAKFVIPAPSDGWAIGPLQGSLTGWSVHQDKMDLNVAGGGHTIIQGWVDVPAGTTALNFQIDDVNPKPNAFLVQVDAGKGAISVNLLDISPKPFSVPV